MSNSGICVGRVDCDDCTGSGINKVQVFEQEDGKLDGFCFVCATPKKIKDGQAINTDSGGVARSPETTAEMMAEIATLPFNGDRGIHPQLMKLFGVRTALSESDGKTITDHFYPAYKDGKLSGYEQRIVEGKLFFSVGDRKGKLELGGQGIAKRNASRKLFITEGWIDMLSLYQALVDNQPAKYRHMKPSVVTLTRGISTGLTDILNNRKFVDGFDEVILVVDNDAAGDKGKKDILKTFPEFKVVTLPENDPNDMLTDGKGSELARLCMWNSVVERQGQVLDIKDFLDKMLIKPVMGISFPWPSVTKATFGIRPHTIHVVGAAPKIGKTDHQHQLVEHLVFKEKVKIGMFDLENAPSKTAKKLAGKHDKIDYTRPDIEYDDAQLTKTAMEMNEIVRFYDRSASRDWDDIRIAMEEMHLLDGINIFILDPLTALVSRYASSEANDKLNVILTDMADMVLKYPITIFLYSHVNPKQKGKKSHEEGGKVYSNEFTGSRAMEKWTHYGHGISRDRSDDCPTDRRNISTFTMLYDRDFGQHYNCDVYFDEATITYLETGGSGITRRV